MGIQLISPAGNVVASASSLEKDIKAKLKHGGNKESAKLIGSIMADRIKATGVEEYALIVQVINIMAVFKHWQKRYVTALIFKREIL